MWANFRPTNLDLLLSAKNCVLKFDCQVIAQISAAPRPGPSTAAAETTKELLEDVGNTAKTREVASASTLDASMPKPVVRSARIVIRQHFIRLIYLFEAFVSTFLMIDIWMVFARHAPVRPLQVLLAGVLVNLQNLIVVAF
jgi:hypothetical protein